MAKHATPTPASASHKNQPSIITGILQFISGMCVIAGTLCAIFFTWAYWGVSMDTAIVTRQMEHATTVQIETPVQDKIAPLRTATPPVEAQPPTGQLYAYIRVPALGVEWKRGIQEGVSDEILSNMGAGHYPQTPLAGQVGNSAYAGHDTPNDFGAFYDLEAGNEVIIEGATNWYVYELTDHLITTNTDGSVLSNEAIQAARGITLTTCWPRFTAQDTGQRFVWHGVFKGWAPKSEGVPESLAQTHTTFNDHVTRTMNTISNTVNMPVTGVLAIGFAMIWVICNGFCWIIARKSTLQRLQDAPITYNPVTWLWRLQAGLSSHKVVANILRFIWFIIMLAAVWFAMWRWVCPWAAETLSWVPNTPHSTLT